MRANTITPSQEREVTPSSAPTGDVLMTSTEVAFVARVHKVTAERLAASGELPAKKVGRVWRYSRRGVAKHFGLSEEDITRQLEARNES